MSDSGEGTEATPAKTAAKECQSSRMDDVDGCGH
jgi:hypothetical protein